MEETIALYIRHPPYSITRRLYKKGEANHVDVETYCPVDKNGIEMTNKLLDYLQIYFRKVSRNRMSIFCSPIRRAEEMAQMIGNGLLLNPKEMRCFSEVPFSESSTWALELIERAKQKGIHPVDLWIKENPGEIVRKINDHFPLVQEGIEMMEYSNASVNLVFSHRLAIALMVWLIRHKENKVFTEKNIPEFLEYSGKIAFSSITQIVFTGKKWQIMSVGKVPHLRKNPRLIMGTF